MLPLNSPAGLDIQARRGDEIALSIMAEIVQKRRNAEMLDLALFHAQEESAAADQEGCSYDEEDKTAHEPKTAVAIDPICHMEVAIKPESFTSVYDDETYYFCCAGCKTKFDANPAAYVGEKFAG